MKPSDFFKIVSICLFIFLYSTVSESKAETADTESIALTSNKVNRQPVAEDNTYSLGEDSSLTVETSKGVLAYDSDPEGDPLTAELVSSTSNGDITLKEDGSFIYTPGSDFSGIDSFTYKAKDTGGLFSNNANITIIIRPVNDPPALEIIGNKTIDEGQLLKFTVTATDIDDNTLSLTATSLPGEGTSNPAVFIDNSDNTATFSWTPDYTKAGNYNPTFVVSDGKGGKASETITLTVNNLNRPPVAEGRDITMDEDNSKAITLVAIDADPLNYGITVPPVHGDLSGTLPDLTYTPKSNYNGQDSFTFNAYDGNFYSNEATVTITVRPVNDTPVANNDSYSVDENKTLTITANGVLANDSDPDEGTITVELLSNPAHGKLLIEDTTGFFIYRPYTDYYGPDSFRYKTTDAEGLSSNEATVTITVKPVNDSPIADSDTYSVDEDNKLTTDSAHGVLANDSDEGSLIAEVVSSTTKGDIILSKDGSFTYTPDSNFNGIDSFTYKTRDEADLYSNIATVTITVNPVNDAPILAVTGNRSVDENNLLSITLSASDIDNGDSLTYSVSLKPKGAELKGNIFTWTPDYTQAGNYNLTFTVSDNKEGGIDSDTITLTVNNLTRPPVAYNDNYSTDEDGILSLEANGVLNNDINPDEGAITAELISSTTNGDILLNEDGSFTYTPNANFYGNDSFTYKVKNVRSESNPATVSITVNTANDMPVFITDIQDQSIEQNGVFKLINLDNHIYDPDTADQDIMWEITPYPADNFDISFDDTTRIVTISVKDAEWTGEERLTFTAKDDTFEISNSALFQVKKARSFQLTTN